MVHKVITTTPTTAITSSNSCRTERGRDRKEELWLVGGVKGCGCLRRGVVFDGMGGVKGCGLFGGKDT